MSEGAWVLVVALVLATAFGAYRAARDGRFRGTHPVRGAQPVPTARTDDPDGGPGDLEGDADGGPADQTTHEPPLSVLHETDLDHELGERATLLQFSSAFCAPCRATRRVLHEVAEIVPGVVHVEIDAEHHLDLVRTLGVLRTPTTLILDEHGREVSRAAGAPKKDEVLTTLAAALGDPA